MTSDLLTVTIDPAAMRALRSATDALSKKLILDGLEKQMAAEGSRTVGHVVRTQLSGDPLNRRTGILAKSVTSQVTRAGGLPAVRVGVLKGPALAYAATQEFGATIRPRKAKALAIPIEGGRAMTEAGVHRYTSPRDYPGRLIFLPAKTKRPDHIATLWDQRDLGLYGPDPGAKPVYRLAMRVTIKAKYWLKTAVEEYAPQVAIRLGTWFQEYVRNAFGRFG